MADTNSSGQGVASRLAAFLRTSPGEPATYSQRPEGRLVWLHVPDDMPVGPVRELCHMIVTRFEGVHCLLTAADPAKWQVVEDAIVAALPFDQNAAVEEFIKHWQPDLLLWADPVFRVRFLQRFNAVGKPMFLINLPVLDLSRRSLRRAVGSVLDQFAKAQVISAVAVERLVSLGYSSEKITQVLPVSEMAWPLGDDENRRRALSAALGPRPIWCAAHMRQTELSAISNAHHLARKSFPTAALILVPALGADVREIARILSADGWRVGRDTPENMADPQSEILVTDGPKELGVWYRLASVCVMGGSLAGPASCDPFEATALGSAVVAGPITFPHGSRYRQLAMGNAMVRVEDISQLGVQLTHALAPDRSAELATNAWQVGSEGVEALTQIVDLAGSVLEAEPI